ncbi:MAG: hypothetical protein EA426_14265 [Spirochaetaceae bacterium]|nr:MAG: hypothetical protein EA426_14265 [Spirochaetaceae bacterium]
MAVGGDRSRVLLIGVSVVFATLFSKFTVDPAFDFIKHVNTMLPVHTVGRLRVFFWFRFERLKLSLHFCCTARKRALRKTQRYSGC